MIWDQRHYVGKLASFKVELRGFKDGSSIAPRSASAFHMLFSLSPICESHVITSLLGAHLLFASHWCSVVPFVLESKRCLCNTLSFNKILHTKAASVLLEASQRPCQLRARR